MPQSKLFDTAALALADLSASATIMVGGHAGVGVPRGLLSALASRGVSGLTLITDACDGQSAEALALITARQVQSLVCPPPIDRSWDEAVLHHVQLGSLQLEPIPRGTLSERIRAAGAGIGAFLVYPHPDPAVNAGKERQQLDGREYVIETPLRADFALLRAHKADTLGNLIYQGTGRNWNPVMATAATTVVVEVDEVVEPGSLDPEAVITQGIYVDRIVEA